MKLFKWSRPNVLLVFWVLALCKFGTASSSTTATQAHFEGNKAYDHLLKQVGFGPRLPASAAMTQTRDYILNELSSNGFSTGTQTFPAKSQLLNRTITGVNLYGVYPPGGKVQYLLSAHYDTRPFADQDLDPAKRQTPIAGANDGASGVAVLLELARVIRANPPAKPVALVFFDAEDHGLASDTSGFCLGSRYMAQHLPPALDFQAGINIDMVGDNDLRFTIEGNSNAKSPDVVERLWNVGAKLQPFVFVRETGRPIFDDHMPFIQAGRNFVDLIDFDYPQWHTTQDTADKCSARSLEAVGSVLDAFIREQK